MAVSPLSREGLGGEPRLGALAPEGAGLAAGGVDALDEAGEITLLKHAGLAGGQGPHRGQAFGLADLLE
jgi:hypothetical protein